MNIPRLSVPIPSSGDPRLAVPTPMLPGSLALRDEIEARRLAEERFRALFDQSFQLIGMLTPEGVVIEANRASLAMIGATLEDVAGKLFWETRWWAHSTALQERLRAGVASAARGEFVRFEASHMDRAGESRRIDFSLKPIFDDVGRVVMIIPEGRDVTELRRATEVLERIGQITAKTVGPDFFHVLTDELSVLCGVELAAVAEVDEATGKATTLAMSRRGERLGPVTYSLRGTPCEQIKPGSLCYYPAGVARAFPEDAFLKNAGLESYMGVALCSGDGKAIGLIALLHTQGIPRPSEAESILRVVAARSGAELERVQADRKLDESRRRMEALIANSPGVAIQWFDRDGRVVLWNRASERMFGYTAEEAVGKTLGELIYTAEEMQGFRGTLAKIGTTGESVGPEEYSFRRRNGDAGTCLSTIFPIPGEKGESWFVCMDVDVTEQRKLDERLRRSQRLGTIGQLAGGVAHDFNNLLTVIIGYSDMLMTGRPDANGVWNAAAAIRTAGERAALFTRQLLAFSSRKSVEPRNVDVGASIRTVEGMLKRLIGPEIELILTLPERPAVVRIDPGQLEQVVLNLVVNARDAMPSGGKLRIRVEGGPWIKVVVADSGRGIPADLQDRIFEPFFTTKPAGAGSGLGLATVQSIMTQSSGWVSVDSAPGSGAVFTLGWPASAGEVDAAMAEPKAPAHGGSETILLAEDEPVIRELARTVLQANGYDVLVGETGERALEVAAGTSRKIHLLVSDLVMPGIRGTEVAEMLRKVRGAEIPALFVSGNPDDSAVSKRAAEMGTLLAKPFTPAKLLKKVREILDGK